MTSIYREILIKSIESWKVVQSIVAQNAKACAEAGKPLRIIITDEDQKRNAEQNKRLWAALYKQISEQAWVNGRQYDKDIWHEYFARRHGVCEDVILPDGEIVVRRKSTTQMTVAEFARFMSDVEVDAATNLGVVFDGN